MFSRRVAEAARRLVQGVPLTQPQWKSSVELNHGFVLNRGRPRVSTVVELDRG